MNDPTQFDDTILCNLARRMGEGEKSRDVEFFTSLLAEKLTFRRASGVVIDVIVEHAFSCSSPRSYVAMFHLKGAVGRVAEGGTAFGNRQASHAITLDGVWRPGEDFGTRDTAWTREFFAALGRFREGVYVNFLGGDEDPDRVREAYGDSVYDRLVDVKTTYDPDNVFHQNIRPGLSDGVGGSDGAGDV
jgi:hypothetical protein